MKLQQKNCVHVLLLLQIFWYKNCFQEISVPFECLLFVLIDVFILCVTIFIRELHKYMWLCFHFTDSVSQPSEAIPERTTLNIQKVYVEF